MHLLESLAWKPFQDLCSGRADGCMFYTFDEEPGRCWLFPSCLDQDWTSCPTCRSSQVGCIPEKDTEIITSEKEKCLIIECGPLCKLSPFLEPIPWSIIIPVVILVPAVVLVASMYMIKSGHRCTTIYKDAKSAARKGLVVEHASRIGPPPDVTRNAVPNNATKSSLIKEANEKTLENFPRTLEPGKLSQPTPPVTGYITLAEAMTACSEVPNQPKK